MHCAVLLRTVAHHSSSRGLKRSHGIKSSTPPLQRTFAHMCAAPASITIKPVPSKAHANRSPDSGPPVTLKHTQREAFWGAIRFPRADRAPFPACASSFWARIRGVDTCRFLVTGASCGMCCLYPLSVATNLRGGIGIVSSPRDHIAHVPPAHPCTLDHVFIHEWVIPTQR